jgi:hypothetical protein
MDKNSLRFQVPFIFDWFPIERQKNPAFGRKTGFHFTSPSTAFHRRPIVKRIQAGFLAYGSSYSLPLPIPSPEFVEGSKDSGLWQVSSPITAAWPSPIRTGFPFKISSHLNTYSIVVIYTTNLERVSNINGNPRGVRLTKQ